MRVRAICSGRRAKHRRGLGDVRQGVVAAGKWHGVKVQRTVAQPNHQRANSRRDRRSGRQPNRQPSNHLRSAVLSPLPHQCRCHDSQHTQEPQQHKWRDEEVLGFAAQILVHPLTRACDGHDGMDWRGDPRPQATDQHTGRRQTQHHKQDRPCPRRPRCTGRLGRSAKTGWLGHRCVAKSAESTCPWREQRAHQPSGRTWTTIRRPHCAQNRGAPDPSEPLSAWPYPPVPRCTRCTRRQRPERVVFQPRFPPFTGWR